MVEWSVGATWVLGFVLFGVSSFNVDGMFGVGSWLGSNLINKHSSRCLDSNRNLLKELLLLLVQSLWSPELIPRTFTHHILFTPSPSPSSVPGVVRRHFALDRFILLTRSYDQTGTDTIYVLCGSDDDVPLRAIYRGGQSKWTDGGGQSIRITKSSSRRGIMMDHATPGTRLCLNDELCCMWRHHHHRRFQSRSAFVSAMDKQHGNMQIKSVPWFLSSNVFFGLFFVACPMSNQVVYLLITIEPFVSGQFHYENSTAHHSIPGDANSTVRFLFLLGATKQSRRCCSCFCKVILRWLIYRFGETHTPLDTATTLLVRSAASGALVYKRQFNRAPKSDWGSVSAFNNCAPLEYCGCSSNATVPQTVIPLNCGAQRYRIWWSCFAVCMVCGAWAGCRVQTADGTGLGWLNEMMIYWLNTRSSRVMDSPMISRQWTVNLIASESRQLQIMLTRPPQDTKNKKTTRHDISLHCKRCWNEELVMSCQIKTPPFS